MADRLQKIIAAYGITSRRKAEEMLAQGRVRLNGRPAVLGDCADPLCDTIEIDGKALPVAPQKLVLMLNKPRGYITSASDEKGRRTVLELVPHAQRLFPVGRLDYYSEGLLLLTNDGALAQRLTHPSREVIKVYHLWVSSFSPERIPLLSRPIELDGAQIRPPKVRLLAQKNGIAMLEITIHEGKNRQIRRMCEQAGLTATRLRRVQEGELRLGGLEPGCWRELTARELTYLDSL